MWRLCKILPFFLLCLTFLKLFSDNRNSRKLWLCILWIFWAEKRRSLLSYLIRVQKLWVPRKRFPAHCNRSTQWSFQDSNRDYSNLDPPIWANLAVTVPKFACLGNLRRGTSRSWDRKGASNRCRCTRALSHSNQSLLSKLDPNRLERWDQTRNWRSRLCRSHLWTRWKRRRLLRSQTCNKGTDRRGLWRKFAFPSPCWPPRSDARTDSEI